MRILTAMSAAALLGLVGCGGEREVEEPVEAEAGEGVIGAREGVEREGVIGAREGVEREGEGVLTGEREVEREGEIGEAGVAREEE